MRAMTLSFANRIAVRLGVVLCVSQVADAQVRQEFSAVHMGVAVRIMAYAPSESVARDAARAAFARIAELDDKMSDYRAQSEVRMLSERPGDWQVRQPRPAGRPRARSGGFPQERRSIRCYCGADGPALARVA